jgi:hypothetical protein
MAYHRTFRQHLSFAALHCGKTAPSTCLPCVFRFLIPPRRFFHLGGESWYGASGRFKTSRSRIQAARCRERARNKAFIS